MTKTRSLLIRLAMGLLFGILLGGTPSPAADNLSIAAAANLNHALPAIADLFTRQTGKQVRISFGSSGNFARQISQGAPFGMFLSADESYIKRLSGQGLTRDGGHIYALGRIVLFAPEGSIFDLSGGPENLPRILSVPGAKRFAIANPEHAPYGRAAKEALVHIGVWDTLKPRLVFGENASQATQFAISGSTDGGLIPYSQALVPAVSKRGSYVMVPESWHAPLRQRMVLLKNADETVQRFYKFMQTPEARAIINRYGFALPVDKD